jgi:hypothetical protein
MDVQPLQTAVVARRGGPDMGVMICASCWLERIAMNFDCEKWRTQDELWEMSANDCEDEEDGDSIVLSYS